jgi:hypothetical protein
LNGIVAGDRLLRLPITYDNAINDPRTKAPAATKGYDAKLGEIEVQIETCLHSTSVSYRGTPKYLLVLRANREGRLEEIFAGPFEKVGSKMKSHESVTDKKFFLKVADLIDLNVHDMPRNECEISKVFLPHPKPVRVPPLMVPRTEEELTPEESRISEAL